ncbi:MAG: prepilin peptidase [Dongiaceae bacterium]
MIMTLIGALFAGVVSLAIVIDLATFRIPNLLPAAIVVLFACAAILAPHRVDWLGHIGAGLLVLAAGAVAFARRMLGGGDVKLMASAALWFGWPLLLDYLLLVGLIGGFFGGVLLLTRPVAPMTEPYWFRLGLDLPRVLRTGEAIPYGMAIGAAALVLIATSGSFGGP